MSKEFRKLLLHNSIPKFRKFREALPMVASEILANQFEEHFRQEGYYDENGTFHPWEDRASGGSRGILQKTGRMRRSLRAFPRADEARVVTDVPYFEAHDQGFKGRVNIPQHTRKVFAVKKEKFRTRSGRLRTVRTKLDKGEVTVKAHTRQMNLPQRQIFSDAKPALDEIEEHIFDSLDRIFLS